MPISPEYTDIQWDKLNGSFVVLRVSFVTSFGVCFGRMVVFFSTDRTACVSISDRIKTPKN